MSGYPQARPGRDGEFAVRSDLTPRRRGGRRRIVENDEFIGGFLERIITAAGRRVAQGDPEALADLVALGQSVDAAVQEGVDGLRAQGYSWSAIGAQLGVTKQTAHERFARQVSPANPVGDEDPTCLDRAGGAR